jgi:hypothetical protein
VHDERRPASATPASVEAVGKLSEAFEYAIRARGHLYSMHQLIGHADFLVGEAADMLEAAGHTAQAERLRRELVGRNLLHGRWSFQIVEEFDDTYYDVFADLDRTVRDELMEGIRHVHESQMKDGRITPGQPGHERRPDEDGER